MGAGMKIKNIELPFLLQCTFFMVLCLNRLMQKVYGAINNNFRMILSTKLLGEEGAVVMAVSKLACSLSESMNFKGQLKTKNKGSGSIMRILFAPRENMMVCIN